MNRFSSKGRKLAKIRRANLHRAAMRSLAHLRKLETC